MPCEVRLRLLWQAGLQKFGGRRVTLNAHSIHENFPGARIRLSYRAYIVVFK